jgi:hypothetical protein
MPIVQTIITIDNPAFRGLFWYTYLNNEYI